MLPVLMGECPPKWGSPGTGQSLMPVLPLHLFLAAAFCLPAPKFWWFLWKRVFPGYSTHS